MGSLEPMSRPARLLSLACSATLIASLASACSGDEADDAPTGPETFISETADPRGEDGLPAGFPRDVAPLVSGQVSSVSGDAEQGWSINTTVDSSDVEGTVDQAVDLLVEAGWTARPAVETNVEGLEQRSLSREGDDLVIIQALPVEDSTSLTYLVQVG